MKLPPSYGPNYEPSSSPSKDFLEDLFNNAPYGYHSLDENGVFVLINDTELAMLGYSREEVVGKMKFTDFLPPEEIERFKDNFSKHQQEGKINNLEYQARRKDGSKITISVTSTAFYDEQNNFVASRSTVLDVTELRKTQEDLLHANEMLERTGQIAKMGGWTLDLSTGQASLSREAQRIHEVEDGYILPSLDIAAQWYSPNDWSRITSAINEAIDSGKPYELDAPFVSSKGNKRWVRIQGFPVLKDGKVTKIEGTFQDITEKKKHEHVLQAANVKLLQASKLASLGEIAAGIAHEINNPLAIVQGTARMLVRHLDNPEKLRSKLETIDRSCSRISQIVNGLKKFSRLESLSTLAWNDLNTICKDALNSTKLRAKKCEILTSLEGGSSVEILCDQIEIEQVLIILINNAIDAVKDLPSRWVKVEFTEEPSAIVLRVTDSGPGIQKHILPKIFDPFFTTKNVGEGTGLGLSIAKGILDEHKATISVIESDPNTCFEVRFPKSEAI